MKGFKPETVLAKGKIKRFPGQVLGGRLSCYDTDIDFDVEVRGAQLALHGWTPVSDDEGHLILRKYQ